MTTEHTEIVLDMIRNERKRQEEKFPGQTFKLTDAIALRVLMEEIGEVAKDMNDKVAGTDDETFIKEVVQTAAVAVKWAEMIVHRMAKAAPPPSHKLTVVVTRRPRANLVWDILSNYEDNVGIYPDKNAHDTWWVETHWTKSKEDLMTMLDANSDIGKEAVMILLDDKVI